ncbi:hypothetical protein PENSPDRAFT_252184 [Peniophora sp. CONT]|nr:hypothetical protein PENSPDRAFT_252184 [Peniophora sp. CONT]
MDNKALAPDIAITSDVATVTELARELQAFKQADTPVHVLQDVISKLDCAVHLAPDHDPNKPLLLCFLGTCLKSRFGRTGEHSDLNRAIWACSRAIELLPHDCPRRLSILIIYGACLRSRFGWTNNMDDLEKAISIQRCAVESLAGSHFFHESIALSNLGASLATLYRCKGDLHDIEEAIALHRRAVELTPEGHDSKSTRLSNLASALQSRFAHTGYRNDLDEAILALRRADELISDNDVNKHLNLANLGQSLRSRFNETGNLDDLSNAISTYLRASELTPGGQFIHSQHLAGLANCYQCRYDRTGNSNDLEEATRLHRCAVKIMPDSHSNLPSNLSDLASSLLCVFERYGDTKSLDEAILMLNRAIQLAPAASPDRPMFLSNLGFSLGRRFERIGKLDDLENAVNAARHAVELSLSGDPTMPGYLSGLGSILLCRFRRFGDLADLQGVVRAHELAVELTPDGHPEMPRRLSALGAAFSSRYRCTNELVDIVKSIAAHEHAVELAPTDHPDKQLWLDALGVALRSRFERSNDPEDIEGSLSAHRLAVESTSDGHYDKPRRLVGLGLSFRERFKYTREVQDVQSAIESLESALELTDEGHPNKPGWLACLGDTKLLRLQSSNSQDDYDAAIRCFMTATMSTLGSPFRRLHAARDCIFTSTSYPRFSSSQSLIQAYSRLMAIIPEIIWLGHNASRRFKEAIQIETEVSAAVQAAIAAGELHQAVEWFEAGRSLVWSQTLSLRTPLDELKEADAAIGLEFEYVSRELQLSGHLSYFPNSAQSMIDTSLRINHSDAMDRHRQLAIQYDTLLGDIRQRPGLEEFMRPPKLASLITTFQCANGHLILINVNSSSCDALCILPAGMIKHVALPELTQGRAKKLRDLWTNHLDLCKARARGFVQATSNVRGNGNVFGLVLTRIWCWIVEPVLNALCLITEPIAKQLPHVTWCPTGPLTQLPLHAAGDYMATQGGLRTFDVVVSSYIPSLSALQHCYTRNKAGLATPSVSVITQPDTPGYSPLPGALRESALLRTILPSHAQSFLEHDQATVVQILSVIGKHPWVHFACHGLQDEQDPTQSAFALFDGPLTLSALMGTTAENAELAFLSACQTAVGDIKIPEESAHLAAGMLVAGFKGVVATMWSIGDEDAPIVVEAYYRKLLELRSSGLLGSGQTGASYALHEAVAVLRKRVGESAFVRWAPFVHFGV